jgi:uncharacterized SAM-binding protein YcdF (DUF218 family)
VFFVASKTLWFLAQPTSLIFILLVLAFVLGLLRRRVLAGISLVLAILILGVGAYTTLGYVALAPLEAQFQRPPLPAKVAGIIVLGGGMDADINAIRKGYELNRSGDRFVEALRLAELYPDAKILISGGGGIFAPGTDTEAAAGARFFTAFGIAPARILQEDASRNTEENAQLTKATLNPQPGESWLLITSAFHMPRSVGLFRKAGFDIVPWPADYLTSGVERPAIKLDQPAENLSISTMAMREWTGLLVYWLTGKIDDFFPGPK